MPKDMLKQRSSLHSSVEFLPWHDGEKSDALSACQFINIGLIQ